MKKPENKICEHCKQNFTISEGELSLYEKVGIELPDVRFRIITDPHTDEIPGTHFGTQEGAINKAEMILQKRG